MAVAPTDSPDPMLEAQLLWARYRNIIFGGLAFLILALGAFAAYRYYQDRRESDAAAALGGAKIPADYEQVIAKYPNSAPAAGAYLLFAESQRKDGKFAEANRTLQTFADKYPKHELISTAKMAMAANLESLEKQDEAFAMYQQIASAHSESFNAPLALLGQVKILQNKNNPTEARRLCELIITQYRDSFAAYDAQRLLRTLKVPEPSPATGPSATAAPAGSPAAASNATATPAAVTPTATPAPTVTATPAAVATPAPKRTGYFGRRAVSNAVKPSAKPKP